jgi:hypothetical protein
MPSIAFALRPFPFDAKGGTMAAGGALIQVSTNGLEAIRAALDPADRRLPAQARNELARIDADEGSATELGTLVIALRERDLYVRIVNDRDDCP